MTLKPQSVMVSSPEFTLPAGCDGDFIAEDEQGNLYLFNNVIQPKNSEFFLIKINRNTGEILYSKEIWFSQKGDISFITATCINNHLELYLQIDRPDGAEHTLIKRLFRLDNGEENINPVEVDRFPPGFESDVKKDFQVLFSPDRTLACILREETSSSRQSLMHVKVFDCRLGKTLYEQVLNTNSENEVPAGHGYILDNSGNLYYKYETIDQHRHGIQKIGKTPSDNLQALLPCNGVTLIRPGLELINGDLICSGEMMKGDRASKTNEEDVDMGFFLMKIKAQNLKVEETTFDYLPANIQQKLNYHDKNYFYKLEGIRSYHYSHKIYQHYGSFLIGEDLYVIKFIGFKYEVEKMNGEEMNHYFEREILILKYKNKGLEWIRCLPRRIDHPDKLGLAHGISENKLHLYFFNHEENAIFFASTEYSPSRIKKLNDDSAPIYHIEILPSGQISQRSIGSVKHTSLVSRPPLSSQRPVLRLNKRRSQLYLFR